MKLAIADFLILAGIIGTALVAIGFILGELAAKIHEDHKKGHR